MTSPLTHLNVNVPSKKLTGYIICLHHGGQKPCKKKINAILHMDHPQNATVLCLFMRFVNYYWDMWLCHAHLLKSMTDHSGLKKHAPIPWNPAMQTALDEIGAPMAACCISIQYQMAQCVFRCI
ncbi:hypothetical protein ACHAW6_004274 [Cyclotella cf. meneghiniana]